MAIEESRLDRRQALLGAGLLGAGAVAALLPVGAGAADEEEGEHPAGLQGAWLEHVVPDDGSPTHEVLNLYTQGGGVVGISNSAPNTGSTLMGAWKQVAVNEYQITFEGFVFSPTGAYVGNLRIRALAIYDRATDHIAGPARVDPTRRQPRLPSATAHPFHRQEDRRSTSLAPFAPPARSVIEPRACRRRAIGSPRPSSRSRTVPGLPRGWCGPLRPALRLASRSRKARVSRRRTSVSAPVPWRSARTRWSRPARQIFAVPSGVRRVRRVSV